MKSIEDVNGLRRPLRDDLEIRPPHITAHELEILGVLAELVEEGSDGRLLTVLSNPDQALAAVCDLVDDGQVLVAAVPDDLINPN
ncbi:MAG: hypothetical protein ACI8WY_001230 [Planctomycetota bacterium]